MSSPRAAPILVIAGPTASGKSKLALQVAAEFDGTVINADSMQVYRELRVLTARPTEADEQRVPHRLYGILPASEACSAGRWAELAEATIGEEQAAGRLPIVVGGTGLYLKALIEGLDDIPTIPDEVRHAVRELHEQLGSSRFHAALADKDPAMAARLNVADRQRLIRAYEVYEATGRSLAEWQSDKQRSSDGRDRFAVIMTIPSRTDLYAACDVRVLRMVQNGAIDEVRVLMQLGLDANLPAMKSLGVPQLSVHLNGEITLDEAVSATQKATRNFAKRQFTWFRHQLAADITIGDDLADAQLSNKNIENIFAFIRETCLTAQ